MLFNKRRLSGLCDRFFRGRDSIVEQGESPCLFAVIHGFLRLRANNGRASESIGGEAISERSERRQQCARTLIPSSQYLP